MDLSNCSGDSDNSDDESDHDEEDDDQGKDSDYESSEQGDSDEEDSCGGRESNGGADEELSKSSGATDGQPTRTRNGEELNTAVASATAALANCNLEDGVGVPGTGKQNSIIGSSSSSKLQKVNKLSQYVPYSTRLESSRVQLWANLKAHHCESSIAQGVQLERWIYACNQYLTAFGLAFTKADHIMLIKLCWRSLMHTEQDFRVMKMLAHLLGRLLKLPSLITRSELQLDWQELFELLERVNHNRHVRKQTLYLDPNLLTTLTNLVSAASFYFSAQSTEQMLSAWSGYLCIYSNKFTRYLYLLMLFLPMHLPPEEHHLGWRLWFEDLMAMWIALPTQDTSHHYNYFLYLFSNLAKNAFGYVDWTPYLPAVLQRVKKRFNCKTATDLELTMAASWFVYCISPQNDFLATLKAYFKFRFINHKRIICYLLSKFILRLKIERRKRRFWYDHTRTEHFLTPELTNDFAAWMCEQFEKITFADFEIEHLYNLSLLCSPEMSQRVWSKLAVAEERIFEPDRLKYALSLFSVSLFPMVTDEKLGAGHRTHVIPLLSRLLRSVNTNDHTLAFLHLFAIRSIVIMGIPLEDCSQFSKTEGLSPEETALLKDSAQLDSFPDAFVDLCVDILDCNNDDLYRMSQKGIMVRNIIFEVLVHIFAIVGEKRREALTSRLVHYTTSRIIENVEVVKIVDKMMLACLLSDPSGKTFEQYFSRVSANILSSIVGEEEKGSDSSPRYSDICKSEFVYNWRLLQTCFSFDGKMLLGHRREIVHLLKRIYRIDFEDNFKHNNLITDVLSFLFYILTSIYLPCYAFDHRIEGDSEEARRRQILDRLLKFPYTCKLRELSFKWHQPSEEEISFAKELFREFIRPEMASLEAWTASSIELASSQVEKSFGIILSFLGCVHCIPNFKKDEEKNSEDDDGELTGKYFTCPDIFAIDLFDGENFRETLISLMVAVTGKLQRDHSAQSDNVTVFKLIIEVIDYTLFNYKTITAGKSVSHSIYKSLVKEKSTLPIVQYYYIISYQLGLSCILKRWSNFEFCSTHRKAMQLLLELSTCGSSKIRSQAQVILIDLWTTFPRSYLSCLPQLLANLGKVAEAYDVFKGTLYLLYGSAKQSIALSTEWRTLLAVWPALVAVNNAEKPKIARLFDVWFLPLFTDHYHTMPIQRDLLSGRLMIDKTGKDDGGSLWKAAEDDGWAVPTAEQVDRIEKMIVGENQSNLELYGQLIEKLLHTLETEKLHWRFYILGCTLLDLLIRPDQPFPQPAIQFFVDNLTNELISIRWIAMIALKKILFLHKPLKEVITLSDGYTPNLPNNDLALDCLDSHERYQSMVFHDMIHDGYLDGRPKMTVRFVDQNDLDRVQAIGATFQDAAFLDKFFRLQSIEQEVKTTCGQTVKMWKHLTQVFKLPQTALLFAQIEALLAKKKHNYDKFALEVLAGVVKASPCLPYEQLHQLKTFIQSLFESLPVTFNKESYNHWYNFFQSCFLNRDLRRWSWVFEHFFRAPALFTDRWGSYHQASFMYFIATAQPTNWRYSALSQAVLDRLFEQLDHKYSYVRYSVSFMLSNAFHYRIGIGLSKEAGKGNIAFAPLTVDFIERVQGKLKEALSSLAVSRQDQQQRQMATIKSDLFDTDSPAGQQLVHLLDTVCHWLIDCLKSKSLVNFEGDGVGAGALAHFASFLPQLALIQTSTALNEALQRHARNAISYIAVQVYRPEDISTLIEYIREVAANWNWHTRTVASTFSHTLVFNNRFILRQRPEWVEAMIDIILGLLQDEVIEVRESARQTLRDYIKWDFFNDHKQRDGLIEQCKAKAMRNVSTGEATVESSDSLILRHSGILGLVAFIYAYQAEMPDMLPDIVLFLARRVGDTQPIQKTVTTALRFFKKTHEPYWVEHKRKFSEQQLTELANVLISSSCFA